MASKNNIKTVRLTDEMLELIEAQAGENFTAKFEALVTRCMWELPRKEQELAGIQERIQNENKKLRQIQDRTREISMKITRLESINSFAEREMKRIVTELENIKL